MQITAVKCGLFVANLCSVVFVETCWLQKALLLAAIFVSCNGCVAVFKSEHSVCIRTQTKQKPISTRIHTYTHTHTHTYTHAVINSYTHAVINSHTHTYSYTGRWRLVNQWTTVTKSKMCLAPFPVYRSLFLRVISCVQITVPQGQACPSSDAWGSPAVGLHIPNWMNSVFLALHDWLMMWLFKGAKWSLMMCLGGLDSDPHLREEDSWGFLKIGINHREPISCSIVCVCACVCVLRCVCVCVCMRERKCLPSHACLLAGELSF